MEEEKKELKDGDTVAISGWGEGIVVQKEEGLVIEKVDPEAKTGLGVVGETRCQ